MKKLLAIILLLSFVAQTFGQAIVIADYYISTEKFAKKCENKDKPWLHCNGKCQLFKKINQHQGKEQQNSEQMPVYKQIVLSSRSSFAVFEPPFFFANPSYSLINVLSPLDRSINVFHPPRA